MVYTCNSNPWDGGGGQEGQEFKARVGYMGPCLKGKKTQDNNNDKAIIVLLDRETQLKQHKLSAYTSHTAPNIPLHSCSMMIKTRKLAPAQCC